jgi:hypothetical protein
MNLWRRRILSLADPGFREKVPGSQALPAVGAMVGCCFVDGRRVGAADSDGDTEGTVDGTVERN